jgi:regulator of protease activity HflC (stomatin/prohibitin superfamily)
MKKNKVISAVFISILFASCAVVRPGEIGVKQRLGKLSEKSHAQGPVWYNPFTTKVIKTNIQINDIELYI